MSVVPASPRKTRRTRYFRRMDKAARDRRRSEQRLACDTRRYLRKLLKRQCVIQQDELHLPWRSRPQFHTCSYIEFDQIIRSTTPKGWAVKAVDRTAASDMKVAGWTFVRL